MISVQEKTKIIASFARKEGDTGSPEVQVAIMTKRISELTEHLSRFKKDHSARRSLLIIIARRNHLLRYLSKNNHEAYLKLCSALNLKVRY